MTTSQLTHDLRNDLGSAVALGELGKLLAEQAQVDPQELAQLFNDIVLELSQMARRIDTWEQNDRRS